MIRVLYEFLRRDARLALSYRMQTFFQVAGLFSVAVTFFFLSLMLRGVEGGIVSLDRYGGSYFGFALVGLSVSLFMDTALRAFSQSIRMAQITGTFEAMLTTRTSLPLILSGSALYTLLYTALRAALLLVLAVFIFRVKVRLGSLPALALTIALTALATLALGVISAGFIVRYHKGDPLTLAIAGFSWLLSGVIYPKAILPPWVQEFALLLPMTHALESIRLLLLSGATAEQVRSSILGLAAFSAVTLPLAALWFRFAIDRARDAGSLARH